LLGTTASFYWYLLNKGWGQKKPAVKAGFKN